MSNKNPNDWVRVRDDRTGHHISVTRRAAGTGKHYTILGTSSAVDVNGRPLPAKILQGPSSEGRDGPEGGPSET